MRNVLTFMRLVIVVVFFLLLHSCNSLSKRIAKGSAMGTYWQVTVVTDKDIHWRDSVESIIESVEQSMSTYRTDSEISQLNAFAVGVPYTISQQFYTVLAYSAQLGRQSGGYFNVAMGDVIDSYGFGSTERKLEKLIADSWSQYKLDEQEGAYRVTKLLDIRFNVSAVAKGYAVDQVANYLLSEGLRNFLVDIGGELKASGVSSLNKAWVVAVENTENGIASKLVLKNRAIATSGNYRNYSVRKGVVVGHILDGRNQRPSRDTSLVASVLASSCMEADALATTLMAMPVDMAKRFASDNDLAYMLQYQGSTGVNLSYSDDFEKSVIK